jgi:hypothetical protein
MIDRMVDWLSEPDDQLDILVLLDLPKADWLVVESIDRSQGLLVIGHTRDSFGKKNERVEILCDPTVLKAVKRARSWEAITADFAFLDDTP